LLPAGRGKRRLGAGAAVVLGCNVGGAHALGLFGRQAPGRWERAAALTHGEGLAEPVRA